MTEDGITRGGEPVDIRELINLLDKNKVEILHEVHILSQHVDNQFEVHREEHRREKDYRSQLIRWGVTSVLSGIGVLIALFLALHDRL